MSVISNGNFLNFLKNKDKEIIIKDGIKGCFYKEKTSYDFIDLIYAYEINDKMLADKIYHYICAYNNKTDEIVHINRANADLIEIYFDDKINFKELNENHILNVIEQLFNNKCKDYVEKNIDDLINNENISVYKKELLYQISNGDVEIKEPVAYLNLKVTIDVLGEFYLDQNNYIDKLFEEYKDKYIGRFKKYYIKKNLYEDCINEYKKDTLTIRKEKIKEIIKNEKYKNIQVVTNAPDKTTAVKVISLDYRDSLISKINTDSKILDIPIIAIQEINWRKSKLFNTNEFPEIKNYDEKLLNAFLENKKYNHLPCEYYNNKEFMEKIIVENSLSAAYIGDELLKDKEFMLELLKKYHILYNINPAVWDKELAIKYIEYIKKRNTDSTNQKINKVLDSLDSKYFENFENIKDLWTVCPNDTRINILSKMDKSLINAKEFLDFINEFPDENFFVNCDLINIIKNKNVLIKLCNASALLYDLQYTEDEYKEDKDFIMRILKKMELFPDPLGVKSEILIMQSQRHYLLDKFGDDDKFVLQLAKFENAPRDFLADLKLDPSIKKDKEKLFLLASTNILFYKCMDEDSRETFLTAEILDYSSFDYYETCHEFKDGVKIDVHTLSGSIKIFADNGGYKINFFDDSGHIITFSEATEKMILENLMDEIKERDKSCNFKDYSVNSLVEYCQNNRKILKEDIDK